MQCKWCIKPQQVTQGPCIPNWSAHNKWFWWPLIPNWTLHLKLQVSLHCISLLPPHNFRLTLHCALHAHLPLWGLFVTYTRSTVLSSLTFCLLFVPLIVCFLSIYLTLTLCMWTQLKHLPLLLYGTQSLGSPSKCLLYFLSIPWWPNELRSDFPLHFPIMVSYQL